MSKKEKLENLKGRMLKDNSLPLKKDANKLVFGAGNPETEILFIGEGPGYWEDQKGIPFVGNAGALLNQLLLSIKLPRESVYITNVVHYRPPQNRDPLPEELTAFRPYLDEIINIIQPKIIVTLGRFSMAKFIPNAMISGIHGRPHEIIWQDRELMVVPMYHPAAGLRNGQIKQRLYEDFRKLPEILDTIEKGEKEIKSEQMSLV